MSTVIFYVYGRSIAYIYTILYYRRFVELNEPLSLTFLCRASLYPVFLFLSVIFVLPCPASGIADYVYNSIGLFINFCILCVDVGVLCVSSRGSILQTNKRALLPWILGLRLIMFIVEVLFAIAGTILAWLPAVTVVSLFCPFQAADTLLRVVVGVQWFWLAGTLALYLVAFDPLGCCTPGPITYIEEGMGEVVDGIHQGSSKVKSKAHSRHQNATYNLWLGRLSTLACCVGICNKRAALDLQQVARLVSDVFSDTKFVMTDIQAGLVLATTWQEKHWETFHTIVRKVSHVLACTTIGVLISRESNFRYIHDSSAIHENLYMRNICQSRVLPADLASGSSLCCSTVLWHFCVTPSGSTDTFLTPPSPFLPMSHHPRLGKRT